MAAQQEKPLAYFIHTFPLFSLTFVVDEIALMRELGVEIELFSIRRPGIEEYPAAYAAHEKDTRYVLPIKFFKHLKSHFCSFSSNPAGYFSGLKEAFSMPVSSISERAKLLAYFCEAVELSQWLTPQKYSHLHVHFLFGGALVAVFLKQLNNMSFSVTGHGTDFMVERFLLREKVRHADFVRLASVANADVLQADCEAQDAAKIFQLPFGIDVSKAMAKIAAGDQELECLGSQEVRIINVGRLVWQKGQSYLIDAAYQLKQDKINFRIDIVGEGELRAEIEAQIEKYQLGEQVILHGALAQEAVFSLMEAADIFAFPSVSEGFGIVLLEAMASGLAIVATDTNAVPEIISDGRSGLLCEVKNAEDLAAKLKRLCLDKELCRRLRRNALAEVVERFDNRLLIKKLHTKMMESSRY